MKRTLFCTIALFVGLASLSAQNRQTADTLQLNDTPEGLPLSDKNPLPDVKNFDGFLLDMSLMKTTAPQMPRFTLEVPDLSKDYSRIFQLNPNVTYSQGLSNQFSLSNSRYFSSNPFGLNGLGHTTDNLQMGSFKLKNGMRINTYGEYDKDGWKVPNRSALPWERNNFKGAFEMKSSDGSFGIRIEVQQGRRAPY